VKYWAGKDDLAGKVALSFAHFQRTYPAVGWIRGDVETATETLAELNELRKRLANTERQLEAVRSGPPPGTERYAQGDDVIELDLETAAHVREHGNYRDTTYRGTVTARLTWDEIFYTLGPLLLDEADQETMDNALDGWLTRRYRSAARENMKDLLRQAKLKYSAMRGGDVMLSEEDFGTVLVQLRALGLITRSERKRSVRDTGTYWTLTPYGDERLTGLRAIRKDAREQIDPLSGAEDETTEDAEAEPSQPAVESGD
jgi:hypothetical protein